MPRIPGRPGTNNNVNICINVNKYGKEQENNFDNIAYLHDKITSLTSDLNLLRNNVSDLSSIENFEQKLNQYFDLAEREKIKSLINDQSFNALRSYITKFDEFNSLLNAGAKIKYKETIVFLNEYEGNSQSLVTAMIDGESVIINDVTDGDNDPSTIYKIPIKGFIIGMEMYFMRGSGDSWVGGWTSYNGLETIYDSENKLTYVYLEEGNFDDIFTEARPNNKLKVYSLVIE